MPPLPARQAVDEAERQLGKRAHIEVDHRQLLGAVERGGGADQSEAGIVDHVLRLDALRSERVADVAHGVAALQVGDDHQRPGAAGRRDLVGQRMQAILAPRHQRQRMAVAREHARQRRADAGRSAGDHGDRPQAAHDDALLSSARDADTRSRNAMRSVCEMPSRSAARQIKLSSNSVMTSST